MDIGSNERLTMQGLQVPESVESRIVPKWLFPPRYSNKDRFTSSRPILCWLLPPLQKHKHNKLMQGVGYSEWQGQLREIGSTPAAPPATSRATNPRQHRSKDLSKPQRDIHSVEIKYCDDTRPQN